MCARLNPAAETREAAVSFRALMEMDVEALAHRRRDRHANRDARRAQRGGRAPGGGALPEAIRAVLGARSPMTLTLDFEFETTARQAPRVGFYVRRGMEPAEIAARVQADTFTRELLDQVCELGFIYDGQVITAEERRVIEREKRRLGRILRRRGAGHVRVTCYRVEQFVRFVWCKWVQGEEHGCPGVGHNLPGDLARLLDPVDVQAGVRDFTGGFSGALRWDRRDETYRNRKGEIVHRRPPRRVQFRHIGLHKDFIHLVRRFPGDWTGQFLDTARVAQALFGPGGYRLGALARQLKLPRTSWKLKAPDYGGPHTREFLRDLRPDVFSAQAGSPA